MHSSRGPSLVYMTCASGYSETLLGPSRRSLSHRLREASVLLNPCIEKGGNLATFARPRQTTRYRPTPLPPIRGPRSDGEYPQEPRERTPAASRRVSRTHRRQTGCYHQHTAKAVLRGEGDTFAAHAGEVAHGALEQRTQPGICPDSAHGALLDIDANRDFI